MKRKRKLIALMVAEEWEQHKDKQQKMDNGRERKRLKHRMKMNLLEAAAEWRTMKAKSNKRNQVVCLALKRYAKPLRRAK